MSRKRGSTLAKQAHEQAKAERRRRKAERRGATLDGMATTATTATTSDLELAAAALDSLDVDALTPPQRADLATMLRGTVDALGPQELPRDRGLARRLRAAADVLDGG